MKNVWGVVVMAVSRNDDIILTYMPRSVNNVPTTHLDSSLTSKIHLRTRQHRGHVLRPCHMLNCSLGIQGCVPVADVCIGFGLASVIGAALGVVVGPIT